MIQCMPNSYKDIIDDCISLVTDDNRPADGASETTNNINNSSSLLNEHMAILEDSDETESAQDEDPNDPEWCEPSLRPPRAQ